MSAREKLIRFAKHNEPSDGTGVPIDPETGRMVMNVEAHMAGLLDEFAHELAERARRGVDVLEEHVGGFQYARDVREILDVVDPTTPDPDGWKF